MSLKITDFMRTCHPCEIGKQSKALQPGVGKYHGIEKKFSFINLDVVDPLLESEGLTCLILITDCCSKWFEALALQQATSQEIYNAFLHGTAS